MSPSRVFTVQGMATVAEALVAVPMLWATPAPTVRDWYELGQLAVNASRLLEARERFRHALATDPGCHQAYRGLAVVAGRSGDEQAGYDLTTRAIQVVERDLPPDAPWFLAGLLSRGYYKGRAVETALDTLRPRTGEGNRAGALVGMSPVSRSAPGAGTIPQRPGPDFARVCKPPGSPART